MLQGTFLQQAAQMVIVCVPESVNPYVRKADDTALSWGHTRLPEMDWRLITQQPPQESSFVSVTNGRGGCQMNLIEVCLTFVTHAILNFWNLPPPLSYVSKSVLCESPITIGRRVNIVEHSPIFLLFPFR